MDPEQPSIILLGLSQAGPNSPLTSEGIKEAVARESQTLEANGWYALTALIDDPVDYDLTILRQTLRSRRWTAVSIGFGIRGQAKCTPLFEQLVNTIIEEVNPPPKFVFQITPNSIVDRVQAVFGKPSGISSASMTV